MYASHVLSPAQIGADELQADVAAYLHERRRRSLATVAQYRFVLERVWLPWCAAAGITRAAEATDQVMQRFTESLQTGREKPLSVLSVRTYVRAVRLFLSWAKVPKGVYRQPAAPERLLEVLTRPQIDLLERAATDERDRLIVRVLADTGIRVSELLGLRAADLRENRHDRTYAIRVIGKRDREREVPIPQKVFVRLRHHAEHGELAPGGYIFRGKRARSGGGVGRLTRSGAFQLVSRLGELAEIGQPVYPHLFRHSYATWKLAKGMNPVTLMKIMGHTSLAMISTTYAHLNLADTYAAMLATED